MVDLSTSIGSLHLKNPTILASGIMDEDAGSMIRILNSGAAAIVTKSIGVQARNGHPNPTFIELEYGLLNAMGLPNPGIEEFETEIREVKKNKGTLIGSIFGSTSEEFQSLAQSMEKYGANAVELNVSCPHASGYGLEIGQDPTLLEDITNSVKKVVKIPVLVKLSPNVTNIVALAKAVEKGNADGIVAINTIKAMSIDLDIKKPILSNQFGGYSGKAIKPIGVRNVFDIFKHVNIPIIGVGGITNGEDAIEYILAGASAVQIGSGVYYRGIDIFKQINKEISDWMDHHQYEKISEIIGVAHQ